MAQRARSGQKEQLMKLTIGNLDRIAKKTCGTSFYYAGTVVLSTIAERMVRKAIYSAPNGRTSDCMMGVADALAAANCDVVRWAGKLPDRDKTSVYYVA